MLPIIHLRKAVRVLHNGGLVAYPTEGVWGLGCDPWNEDACSTLLTLKQRDWRKGLILVASDFSQLEDFIERPSNSAMKRAQATWPGPATWVFPCSEDAPPLVTGENWSVAVRVSAHPIVRALCESFGGALVSTSANRAGQPPARSIHEVRRKLGPAVQALVPGPLGKLAGPTPIRDVRSGLILRR